MKKLMKNFQGWAKKNGLSSSSASTYTSNLIKLDAKADVQDQGEEQGLHLRQLLLFRNIL